MILRQTARILSIARPLFALPLDRSSATFSSSECFCACDHGTVDNRTRDTGAPFAVRRPIAHRTRLSKVSGSLNAAPMPQCVVIEKAVGIRMSSPTRQLMVWQHSSVLIKEWNEKPNESVLPEC